MTQTTEPRAPDTVSGKWLVPASFIGFVLFTLAMSFGTIFLGKAMRPALHRRQIEREKAEMREEAKTNASVPVTNSR